MKKAQELSVQWMTAIFRNLYGESNEDSLPVEHRNHQTKAYLTLQHHLLPNYTTYTY